MQKVIVEDGQPRLISGAFTALAPTTYDVWGFPVEVAQATNFPSGWLSSATPAELEAMSIFEIATPEPPAGEVVASKTLALDEAGVPFWEATFAPSPEPIVLVPQEISRMQARLALEAAGLLTSVEALIATKPKAVQIYWADVSILHRDHPVLLQVANGLGLSQAQIDALFISAKQIA